MGVKPDPVSERTRVKVMIFFNAAMLLGPGWRVSHGIHGPVGWLSLFFVVVFALLLVVGIRILRRMGPKDRDAG